MTVIYNNGNMVETIPYKEIPIKWTEEAKPENLMKISKDLSGIDTKGDIFGRVSNVPITMMAVKYKEELDEIKPGQVHNLSNQAKPCTARCFERLLGYVDFEGRSTDNLDSLEKESYNFSVPVCMIESAGSFEVGKY